MVRIPPDEAGALKNQIEREPIARRVGLLARPQLAANTSYADFPRLASILASDGFAPTQFTPRGDRLAFSNGIIVLTLFAIALVVIFRGSVFRLIPLYAVGVFLSFTLSQAGMVVHWRRHREPRWHLRALINALGAMATAVVLVVFVTTKFQEGAWVVLVTIPLGVCLFLTIAGHYEEADRELSLGGFMPTPDRPDVIVVILTSMNRVRVEAVRYAVKRCQDVRAVHVDLDAGCAADVRRSWDQCGAAQRSSSWNRRTGRLSNRSCSMWRRSRLRGPIG